MQHAGMHEGCRFHTGKILHELLQETCVVCKRATEGTQWRWRSAWQPRQQWRQRGPWQQR